MNIIKKLLFYVSVPKCVSCGERLDINDRGVCSLCLKEYKIQKLRECSVCSKVLSRCTCTNDYLKTHYVKKLVKLFRYVGNDINEESPSNMLVYSMKRDNREDVLCFLSDELCDAIRHNLNINEEYIVTSVPRRKKAIKRYGIDHAKLLAKAVAKRLGIPYYALLKSTAKAPQKKMHGFERIKNAEFDYKLRIPDIKNRRVIIIDDVVTSGASMGRCAMLIQALKPKEIVGAALSIAYRDKGIDFEKSRPFA